jgi:excisionase family DNA binding protein
MYPQSQPSDPVNSSIESVTQGRVAAERRTWLTAAEAAQYLNVKTRTIVLWAPQGKVKAYALTGTQRRVWRFLHADLEAMVTQKKPVVISAQPSVLANERSI